MQMIQFYYLTPLVKRRSFYISFKKKVPAEALSSTLINVNT